MHQPSRESYEDPKTQEQPSESDFEATSISNVLGNFEGFLAFISRRNENIVEFSKRFEKVEELNDLDALNKEILPAIISCLQEEFSKLNLNPKPQSNIQRRTLKKILKGNQDVISLFQKEFSSFDEFYESILRAYTVIATLREKLFEYLQNEDRMGLDTILPYLFCLFKTFFNFKPNRTSNETETSKESSSLFLYKGDAFDESPLNLYDPQRKKPVPWSVVASTSTNMQIAQQIMDKDPSLQKKKYPVMFIIEIPRFETESNYLRYLDVTPYSVLPEEKEVILPPGSVFETLEVSPPDEERKITTIRIKLVSASNNSQHEMKAIERGMWQWKSQTSWVFYPFNHNELIEEAYHQNRDTEIDNFIVSPLSLIQIEKGGLKVTTPIRRISWIEDEETDRIFGRYFEQELPKDIGNKIVNLSNYLTFIKSHDNRGFMKEFEEIEASGDIAKLNQEIVPKIQECLQNEVEKASSEKPSESDISALLNSLKAEPVLSYEEKILAIQRILKEKMEKKCGQLTKLFTQKFGNFQSFYGCILQAYTMTTFLYLNLNKYLRDEDWNRLHALLPYLFCLCKAFFREDLKAHAPKEPKYLTLFRGVCLDQDTLSVYRSEKMKIFYWNSLTSATSTLQVAKNFIDITYDGKDQTYKVLFKIVIPVTEEKFEYLRHLDIKSFSAHPKEDEVILPPVSVFEIKDSLKEENEKEVTIILELK